MQHVTFRPLLAGCTMQHYRGKKTPFGLAHERQKKPVQLGKKEYCEHFRPVLRAARDQSVYIPTLNLSGICQGISRHKEVSRQTIKIRTPNGGKITKVKRSLAFGMPGLNSFTQDTRTGNWYTVDAVDDDHIQIDAIMVNVPANAAPANAAPTNAVRANAVPTNDARANAAPANAVRANAAPSANVSANVSANAAPANASPANAAPTNGGTAASVAVAVAPPTAPPAPGKCYLISKQSLIRAYKSL